MIFIQILLFYSNLMIFIQIIINIIKYTEYKILSLAVESQMFWKENFNKLSCPATVEANML